MYKEETNFGLTRVKRILAVAAGKGGVGKSTVSVNLALALQEMGASVALLDADIYGPSIRRMLPEKEPPKRNGKAIVPAVSHGIKIISMAYFRNEGESTSVRAPIANGIITQFVEQVDWGELDYVIVDFPPGTGDVQLTLAQKIPFAGAIVVTTPQEVALLDVRKAIHLFQQVKIPLLGVVENMSYLQTGEERLFPFGKGGGEKLASEFHVPLLGQIPIDAAISESGDSGSPLTGVKGSFLPFKDMARALLENWPGEPLQDIIVKFDSPSILSISIPGKAEKKIPFKELQRRCPCAGCVDESTGRHLGREVREDVTALGMELVGRYAIRIRFSSGCNKGIYHLDHL